MTELHDALRDVAAMRAHLIRGMEFRGYGPTTLATTGALALLVAGIQAHLPPGGPDSTRVFLGTWIGVAGISVILIGVETFTRVRRVHSGLAMRMLYSAVEQFLPAIVAGFLLMVVMQRCAPATRWMLPGLWQLLFSLGVFASCPFLPRPTFLVGVWYLACGLACIALGGGEWAFSPWEMGVPFGVGQLAVATILRFGDGYRSSAQDA